MKRSSLLVFRLPQNDVPIVRAKLDFVPSLHLENVRDFGWDGKPQRISYFHDGSLQGYGHTWYSAALHLYIKRFTVYSVCVAPCERKADWISISLRMANETKGHFLLF